MVDNASSTEIRAAVHVHLAQVQLPAGDDVIDLLVQTEPARRQAVTKLMALPDVVMAPMAVEFTAGDS